ncbi:hypothetical protein H4R33_003358 [Dimargaris cristalligena]|nr:hypothetical protein H4R33_003358 [Dimargaris cristalligena]
MNSGSGPVADSSQTLNEVSVGNHFDTDTHTIMQEELTDCVSKRYSAVIEAYTNWRDNENYVRRVRGRPEITLKDLAFFRLLSNEKLDPSYQTILEYFIYNPDHLRDAFHGLESSPPGSLWSLYFELCTHPAIPAFIQQSHFRAAFSVSAITLECMYDILHPSTLASPALTLLIGGIQQLILDHFCSGRSAFINPRKVLRESPDWPVHDPIEQKILLSRSSEEIYANPRIRYTILQNLSCHLLFLANFFDGFKAMVHDFPYSFRWMVKQFIRLNIVTVPRDESVQYFKFIYDLVGLIPMHLFTVVLDKTVDSSLMDDFLDLLDIVFGTHVREVPYMFLLSPSIDAARPVLVAKAVAALDAFIDVPDAQVPVGPIPDEIVEMFRGDFPFSYPISESLEIIIEQLHSLVPEDRQSSCPFYLSAELCPHDVSDVADSYIDVPISWSHYLDTTSTLGSPNYTYTFDRTPTLSIGLENTILNPSDPSYSQLPGYLSDPLMIFQRMASHANPPSATLFLDFNGSGSTDAPNSLVHDTNRTLARNSPTSLLVKQRYDMFCVGPYHYRDLYVTLRLYQGVFECASINSFVSLNQVNSLLRLPPLLRRVSPAFVLRWSTARGSLDHYTPTSFARPLGHSGNKPPNSWPDLSVINPLDHPWARYRLAKLVKTGVIDISNDGNDSAVPYNHQSQSITSKYPQITNYPCIHFNSLRLLVVSFDPSCYVLYIYCSKNCFAPRSKVLMLDSFAGQSDWTWTWDLLVFDMMKLQPFLSCVMQHTFVEQL